MVSKLAGQKNSDQYFEFLTQDTRRSSSRNLHRKFEQTKGNIYCPEEYPMKQKHKKTKTVIDPKDNE